MKWLAYVSCFLASPGLFGQQDANLFFSQAGSAYSFYNPALTGITINPRLNILYQRLPGTTEHHFLTAYDQELPKQWGALGATLSQRHDLDSTFYHSYTLAFQYANQFPLGEKIKIRLGCYSSLNRNYFKTPYWLRSPETDQSAINPALGIGTFISTRKSYLGLAVSHSQLPGFLHRRLSDNYWPTEIYSFRAGTLFSLDKYVRDFLIAPDFNVFVLGDGDGGAIIPKLNFIKDPFTLGIAIIPSFYDEGVVEYTGGITLKKIRLGYTLLHLRYNESYRHEIGASLFFGKPREGAESGMPYYFKRLF